MTLTQSLHGRNLFVTLCAAGAVLCGTNQPHAWKLPRRPRRMSGFTLFITICLGILSALPAHAVQVQFPSQPTDPAQCRPQADAALRALREERSQRMTESHERGRAWMRQCEQRFGSSSTREVVNCYKQDNSGAQYNAYVQQQEANVRQIEAAVRQCEAVARENQGVIARQRESEAQLRHAQEQQRRQQQALLEQQQREASLAAARSEALRAQQQADLERANRQQAQQARNEPRVIAQAPANTRNDPRVVQTPQMQAQARVDAEQRARAERAQEQQALRDVAGAVLSGSRSHVRREWYDQTLNPAGTHDAAIDNAEEQARRQNANINRARQINPIATRTADNAYAATGAIANNAVGQLAALDTLNTPAPARIDNGTVGASAQRPAPQADNEMALWDSIKGSTNARDFQSYLSHFPRGRFQLLAENRIFDLTGVPVTQAQQQRSEPSTTDARRRWYRN